MNSGRGRSSSAEGGEAYVSFRAHNQEFLSSEQSRGSYLHILLRRKNLIRHVTHTQGTVPSLSTAESAAMIFKMTKVLECRNIINCSLVHICESFGGTRSKMVARTDLTEVVSTRIVCWTLESTYGRVRRNSVYLTRIFHRNQLFQ